MGQLVLAPFRDLYSISQIEDNMFSTELRVRANDGDFFVGLEDSIEEGLELAEQFEEEMLGYIEPPGYPPPDYEFEYEYDTGAPQ